MKIELKQNTSVFDLSILLDANLDNVVANAAKLNVSLTVDTAGNTVEIFNLTNFIDFENITSFTVNNDTNTCFDNSFDSSFE